MCYAVLDHLPAYLIVVDINCSRFRITISCHVLDVPQCVGPKEFSNQSPKDAMFLKIRSTRQLSLLIRVDVVKYVSGYSLISDE